MNRSPSYWPLEGNGRPVSLDWPRDRAVHDFSQWPIQNELAQIAGALPALDQCFAEDKSLVDRISGRQLITFTRASTATYVDSDGQLKTAAVNEPRFQHDPVTGRCLGLLIEETRTNLLLNSASLSTQNATVTATAHTLSFSGTGTITLSGAFSGSLVGTGDGEGNRVSLTFTPTAGTLTVTVTGTVSNAQLEAGAFRTSWIPTTGTSVQRQVDICSIAGSNFSSFYNRSAWTLYAATESGFNGSPTGNTCLAGIGAFSDGAQIRGRISDVIGMLRGTYGSDTFFVVPRSTGSNNYCLAVADNSFPFLALNSGLFVGGLSSGVLTDAIALGIGSSGELTTPWNGPITRLSYWPTRLPNEVLQAITQ